MRNFPARLTAGSSPRVIARRIVRSATPSRSAAAAAVSSAALCSLRPVETGFTTDSFTSCHTWGTFGTLTLPDDGGLSKENSLRRDHMLAAGGDDAQPAPNVAMQHATRQPC